jgi:RNA polymerase sigma factor (sigma-70 family)
MRDDPSVVALVTRARDGDKHAWDDIVERYAPLVLAICRRYGLDPIDASDAAQTVWLRLVEQLATLREPAALAGWLATTASRECLQMIRAERRRLQSQTDPELVADPLSAAVDQEVLAYERNAALLAAFAQLSPRCQHLLSLLIRNLSYAEVSARLNMPPGSIGPNRARCLDKIRRSPALAAYIHAVAEDPGGGDQDGQRLVGR